MNKREVHSTSAEVLRQHAEDVVRGQAGQALKRLEVLSPEEARETLHELLVHQIELEMQNEELGKSEAKLEESHARYFDLYDLAPVGYCTLNQQGQILEANLMVATMLGVARDALAGQPIGRFILKEDQDVYYLHCKELFATGELQAGEFRMVKSDGTYFWAHADSMSTRGVNGARVCRMTLSDITGRKDAEDLLRAVIETAVDGIIVIDQHGMIEVMNPAAERIFGYGAADAAGQSVNILMPQPDSSRHDSDIENYMNTGRSRIIGIGREVMGLRKDGTTFPMDLAVAVTRLGARTVFTGIVRDLSERKRAEAQLRALENHQDRLRLLRSALEASDIERRRMAGEIHDGIVQDLTGLSYSLQARADRGDRPDAPDASEALREAAADIRAKVQNLRVALTGVEPLKPEGADLPSVISDLTVPLTAAGIAVGMRVSPGLELPPAVEALLFRTAREALENVRKHSHARSVSIRVAPEGDSIVMAVEDDGCGFSSAELEARRAEGHIGLRLLEDLATYAGGSCSVSLTPGVGTRVRVELPAG